MEKCLVKMLKMASTNPNLPIFQNIEIKNYLTTTVDGQYIEIPLAYPANGISVDVIYQRTGNSEVNVVGTRNASFIRQKGGYCIPENTSHSNGGDGSGYFSVGKDVDINAGYNSANGSVYVNGSTGICATIETSTVTMTFIRIFEKCNTDTPSSKAGVIKIKKVTVTIGTTIYEYVPALINNSEAVLYEKNSGQIYREVNNGELSVE